MAPRKRNTPPGGPTDAEERQFADEDEKIVLEARHRFKRAQAWEGDFLKLFNEDTKFANGDSDNGWQWPENIKRERDISNRPCLTINKTKMHVLLLANEARQNPPQARVKPVGDKVSFQAAQVWEGLIRHIEYISDGPSIYVQAKEGQLEGGMAYWHIQPDFEDDRSFNQELRISPLKTTSTFLDCDIKRTDGSDAMWGFIFDEYDRKEYLKLFPDADLPPARDPGIKDYDDWIRKDAVRVAQYYRIKLEKEKLIYLEDPDGHSWTGLEKEIPPDWRELMEAYREGDYEGGDFREREVMERTLQWFKIGGSEILERRDGSSKKCPNLKGRYIPIVRLPGRERVVEGRLYRAGLVRGLKDAQRMYNYNTSGEVEVVALQTKSPWVIAAESVEGNESAWNNANTTNAAYLTYKAIADDGETKLDPPQRSAPPVPAQGFLEGLRIAAAEMEMASGQYQAQFQNPTVERTPQAVDQRKRQGELANYDFTWNEMQAVRHTAVIMIDLLPHYYDTERVVQIKADDGTISQINIDPKLKEAYQKQDGPGPNDPIKVLFNPCIGKYAVEADVGPSYQTQREEAYEAFKEVFKGAPELLMKFGDLFFRAADFPMADELADRVRRDIAATQPWLLDDKQTTSGPIFKKLNEELQAAQGQLAELMTKLADYKVKDKGKDQLRDIEAFDADTRRLVGIGNTVSDLAAIDELGGLKKLIREQLAEMFGHTLEDVEEADEDAIDARTEEAIASKPKPAAPKKKKAKAK